VCWGEVRERAVYTVTDGPDIPEEERGGVYDLEPLPAQRSAAEELAALRAYMDVAKNPGPVDAAAEFGALAPDDAERVERWGARVAYECSDDERVAELEEANAALAKERDGLRAILHRVSTAWERVASTDSFEADREHDAAHEALVAALGAYRSPADAGEE
jgi:hypothetical protein